MPSGYGNQHAIGSFTGRFNVHSRHTSLVLECNGLRLLFSAVERHDLPGSLEGVRVDREPHAPDDRRLPRYEVTSGERQFTVVARSVQIHERAALYGNVISLPRFRLRQRLVWALLLFAARFEWGQALIRRVTGRQGSSRPPSDN